MPELPTGTESRDREPSKEGFHPQSVEKQYLLERGSCVGDCGKNVNIDIYITRHAQRGIDEYLTKAGKEQAKEFGIKLRKDLRGRLGNKPGLRLKEFDLVQTISSYNGPVDPQTGLPRSAETVHSATEALLNGRVGYPDQSEQLEYKHIKSDVPYDHHAIYNSALIEAVVGMLRRSQREETRKKANELLDDIETDKGKKLYEFLVGALSNDKKLSKAEAIAQKKTVDHVAGLDTPKADKWRKESAGAMAYFVLGYKDLAKGMESNRNVLLLAGTHGGYSEWLLKEALVWKHKGRRRIGFSTSSDIGGPINTAESYKISVSTDSRGKVNEVTLVFTEKGRPKGTHHLDIKTMKALAKEYADVHELEQIK